MGLDLSAYGKMDQYLRDWNFQLWLAMRHHRTHKNKPIDFTNHKYLRKIYSDLSDYIVVMKSTQCGITELLTIRAMAKAINGQSVFYVLPTYALVNRFVRNRIDKSVKYSGYYREMEALAKGQDHKRSESMTLKDVGNGSIAFVGSNSTAGFTEYPADDVIIDELDNCDQENIVMAWERLSASEYMTQIKVSNPTFEGFGIDAEFKKTNQMEWSILHDCGKFIRLDWFKHVIRQEGPDVYVVRDSEWTWNCGRDIYPVCDECGRPVLDRKGEGRWLPSGNSKLNGYRVTKLISGNVTVMDILDRFNAGLANDTKMQRFYNADLGQAYTSSGAVITSEMIQRCTGDYAMPSEFRDGTCVAGIDVGVVFHVIIGQVTADGKLRHLYIGEIRNPQDVIAACGRYGVKVGIIDALPERRVSRSICSAIKGMFMAFYGESKRDSIDFQNRTVTVNRTAALDNVKESLMLGSVVYPRNVLDLPDFVPQMCASVRVFNKDAHGGEGDYVWTEGGKADHYFHAEGYALMAKKLLLMLSK